MQSQAQPGRRFRPVVGWSIAVVAVVAVVAGGAVMARKPRGGATSKAKTAHASVSAAPVELTPVRRGPLITYLQATAALEPRNSAVLVARRQGQIVQLLAEEGQWV